jgi:prophage antirepressor-like protein
MICALAAPERGTNTASAPRKEQGGAGMNDMAVEEKIRLEDWNGLTIRFVEKDGQWWAVAADVCKALDIENVSDAVQGAQNTLREAGISDVVSNYITLPVDPVNPNARKTQEFVCVNEAGLNLLIMRSRKKEAVAFQFWLASEVLPGLRKSAGLSGYEAFRLMDKEHQKEAMRRLNDSLHEPEKIDYIKANTIADKAVSARHGFPKLVRKSAMNPAMLQDRQSVLDDTVQLMALNQRLSLGLSVSKVIYGKYGKYGAAAQQGEGSV